MYGQTVNLKKRKISYLSNCHKHQKKLYNATQKYGWNNFSFEILEEVERKKLNEREKYWINYLHTYDLIDANCGYNLTSGDKGFGSKEENPNFGKTGEMSPLWGFKRTEREKQLLSKRMKGKTYTKGMKCSKETIAKKVKVNLYRSRAIICNETKEVFYSVRECSRKMNIGNRKFISSIKWY